MLVGLGGWRLGLGVGGLFWWEVGVEVVFREMVGGLHFILLVSRSFKIIKVKM